MSDSERDTFVVVGGDAAGMSAASKATRDDPDVETVVYERGEWVSYSACGIPHYVEGEVAELSDLVALTEAEAVADRGIDVRTNHEVTSLDPAAQTVTVRERGGETFEQPYDHLLLATGARPTTPPVEGTDLECVFTVRSLDDAHAVREAIERQTPGVDGAPETMVQNGPTAEFVLERDPHVVGVVGAGYVGLEMADALRARGCTVHVFQRSGHVLGSYDDEVARVAEDHLRDEGVVLHLDDAVVGLDDDGTGEVGAVQTASGRVEVDMVVVGTGVAPNVDLAVEAGVDLGETGAIAVDEYNRTNLPDVYAAGDCIEVPHLVTDEPAYVPLALTANRHGRAVGRTVAGTPTVGGGVVGTGVTTVADLEIARTGLTDAAAAREAGFDPVERTITTGSRASYHPGRADLTVHMMADRESRRVLGATMAGTDRVAKRIDTVAAALHARMTLDELERLDLAYAPPVSPTWDPILTAAKVLDGTF